MPNLPLLVYLHGGPGDAALPLVHKYNRALENHFTVVVWEQRGAGKSYYPFMANEPVNIQMMIDDIHGLVRQLLKKYSNEKVYLLGHSWGSMLGLKFIQQYPALVHSYIGCGQVVNMLEGAKRQHGFVLSKSREYKQSKITERLLTIDTTYSQNDWLNDLLFVTRLVVKYKKSVYGKSNYNQFVKDFILSPEYGLRDLINREKGSLQSIKAFWPELMKVNFSETTAYEVPIVFMEGRYDEHVSSALAKEYYDSITTPKQFYWFEKSSHFPQWSEAEKFNEIVSSLSGVK